MEIEVLKDIIQQWRKRCLIGTNGTVSRKSKKVSRIIDTHIEEHSKKPEIVRDRIIELVGDLPRIELFSRQTAKGWDCWGNEVNKFDEGNNI